MSGYSIEVYCHECCTNVARIGPYAFWDELVVDADAMIASHQKRLHTKAGQAVRKP